MTELRKLADARTELCWFAPDRIKVKPGLNGRDLSTPDNIAHVADIAAKIEANGGFLKSKPLEVFIEGDDVFLTDGHVRLAAVRLLAERGYKIGKLPCIQEPTGSNDLDRILNQSAHNSGKPLSPLEEAGNIKRAMGMDGSLTIADIAKRIGKSDTHVSNLLQLVAVPESVKAMVRAGEVSASLATKTVKREGAEATATLRAGVEVAKSKGKRKATPKHIQPKGDPIVINAVNRLKGMIDDRDARIRALETAVEALLEEIILPRTHPVVRAALEALGRAPGAAETKRDPEAVE